MVRSSPGFSVPGVGIPEKSYTGTPVRYKIRFFLSAARQIPAAPPRPPPPRAGRRTLFCRELPAVGRLCPTFCEPLRHRALRRKTSPAVQIPETTSRGSGAGRFFARPFFKKAASPRRSALLLPPLLHRLVVKTIPHGSAPCLCRLAAPQRPARHTRRLAFATARVARTRLFLRRGVLLLPSSGAPAARPVVAADALFSPTEAKQDAANAYPLWVPAAAAAVSCVPNPSCRPCRLHGARSFRRCFCFSGPSVAGRVRFCRVGLFLFVGKPGVAVAPLQRSGQIIPPSEI